MNKPANVILVFPVNRQARVPLSGGDFDHFVDGGVNLDCNDFRARNQDIFDRAVFELQDVGQHFALVRPETAGFIVVGGFEDGLNGVTIAALGAYQADKRGQSFAQTIADGCRLRRFGTG